MPGQLERTEAPRVLIIEDCEDLARILAKALTDMGCVVTLAPTGAHGLLMAETESPILVLLDLGLPDLEGMSVCRQLIALQGPRVMVITARDDPATAEAALELGADDYVRKPFHLNELAARVRVVLRRGQPERRGVLNVGRLSIDLDRCLARIDGTEVHLSATELKLLVYLAERPLWVFSKDQLLEALWPEDRDAHAVQVHISNLRRKIEPDPRQPSIIITVKGLGYKLVP